MKSAIIFTIFVIVGLGVIAGARMQDREHRLIIPRPSVFVEPLAPAGFRGSSRSLPSVTDVMRAQQGLASRSADTAEFTTSTNPLVYPTEYNGDVRNLPKVPARKEANEEFELEMYDPP